jgi:hypothetical protein
MSASSEGTGEEHDVSLESLQHLLWNVAIVVGWLSLIPLAGGWYARRRFRALLKAPLTEEVEQLTHLWEGRIPRWTNVGLFMAGLSILSLLAWFVVRAIV